MPDYLFQVIHHADSALPRDRVINTLHFQDRGLGTDPTGLANDLLTAWAGIWDTNPVGRIMECKVYNYADAVPREPKAHVTQGTVDNAASQVPREVALCLSFYADRNLPRNRGRIYLPVFAHGSSLDARPSAAYMASALQLAQAFADLGGVDVSWMVRSTIGGTMKEVTDAWCDNEWDTMRSRGLRATTRQTLHTGP